MPAGKDTSLLDLVHAASALRDPGTGTAPAANATYLTNAGDPAPWNTTKATELFNALSNDPAIPNGLPGGTTIG